MVSTVWRRRRDYDVAQVDIFSGFAFMWAEAACVALRLAGKPYVLTLHGGNLPQFSRQWPGRVRRLLKSAEVVTTPSRYLADSLGVLRSDLKLLPNPLDVSAYEFRKRVAPGPRLIWLRAFHEIYNPLLAIHVLNDICRDYPDAHLTMVGPDKGDGSLQSVRRLAQSMGISDRLVLPGAVAKQDVPTWLNRGDIFLNTTNIDNTPVSVLEALACGLCVVSTNVGGIPYLLEDGQDGLLTAPGNAEQMAAAVRRIMTEPGLGEHLSVEARKKAERFDWSSTLPQWKVLLNGVSS
jgi:glycosyltransferase involved in cell wall biosynthesis